MGEYGEDELPIIGGASAWRGKEFDRILVCSLNGMEEIKNQLIVDGVDPVKIDISYVETQVKARINWIKDYATDLRVDDRKGCAVAEGGVFRGDFAKYINACFPENDLYLFDTFEGFDSRDIEVEKKNYFSDKTEHHLGITSEDIVLNVLPHAEKAIIRKGYFPQTTDGLEERKYIFVNLDFDLYQPILEGLRYFYPKLQDGCCMLIHDYFNPGYPGVKQAIDDFEKETGKIKRMPIGDHCSIAVMK